MTRGETGEQPPRHAQDEEPSPEPATDRPFVPPARSAIAEALSPPAADPAIDSLSAPPPSPPPPATAAQSPVQSGDAWARVLRAQGMPTVLRTVLTNLTPLSVDLASGRIVLSGATRYADSARSRHAQIVDFCRRELGRTIEIIIQSDDAPVEEPSSAPDDAPAGDSPSRPSRQPLPAGADPDSASDDAAASSPVPTPPREPLIAPSQHPLVKEAMELFGARIVDIQHRRPSA